MFRKSESGEKGAAAIEFSIILPFLLLLVFGVVDVGRLIQARLIVTNVSREGGSLACRGFDITHPNDLLVMLQSSGKPLDLIGSGKIYISRVTAGSSATLPEPITEPLPDPSPNGNLNVPAGSRLFLGLSDDLKDRLTFDVANNSADIQELWIVEVYYKFIPVTPLSYLMPGFLMADNGGTIIGSKSVF
jgi:hypothetical protein